METSHIKCPNCGHLVKKYKNPLPTVDIIIETGQGVVLIERKNFPFGWALPGGFVDYGESLEEAAIREAREETGLSVTLQKQLASYSSPKRDPRFHTVSTVFIASAHGEPVGQDDAKQAGIFTKENLPEMAFDHKQILDDYFRTKK
jgi:ADP-ribose pyrophosphatase YjhB (NUDIX family)